MRRLRTLSLSLTLAVFGLVFLVGEAAALSQRKQTGPFKSKTNSPYRFGYMPQPNILPGTKPKKECISHGQARCIKRPLPPSPFAAHLNRKSRDTRSPLMKRNRPIPPQPSYY